MADPERQRVGGTSEEAPLLGRRGDASQPSGKPLYHNLAIGTGVVAQAGVWVIVAIVWGAVLSNDFIRFFSPHPLLNSAALLILIQGILIVQPTHTAEQKRQGTYAHALINDIGALAAVAGLVIIEINKFKNGAAHFDSVHGKMGLVTYIFIVLQGLVGITQYFLPGLFGGVDNAKAMYKYHRVGGYALLVLMLATVCSSWSTDLNHNTLNMQLWALVVASVVVLIGVLPRVRLSKFGWMAGK